MSRHFAANNNRFSIVKLETGGSKLEVAESYVINGAAVHITRDGRYLVSEPAVSRAAETVWSRLMDNLYYSYSDPGNQDVIQSIKDRLEEEAKQTSVLDIYNREREAIEYYLIRDIAGYREIDVLMRDPGIEDIICTRFDREIAVIHRNHLEKEMLKTNIRFATAEAFDSLLQIISQRQGHAPTTSKPVVSCSTGNNDRITITWKSEISRPGSTLAIRKFPAQPHTITHLLESGALSPLMAAYIWIMNDARSFSLVVGETGSGKTTAINALSCMSNPRWHILTIEEVRELVIPHFWNEYLVTRSSPHLAKSEFDVSITDLGMVSLRKKPHYVIVGEVRGREVQQLFQIALTGHGCISSIHAPSARDLLVRLGGDEMGVTNTQQSSISYLLQIQKIRTAATAEHGGRIRRRISSLTEIVPPRSPSSRAGPELYELFGYDVASESFLPDDIDDVIRNSKRLGQAVRFLGIRDIAQDIGARMDLLNQCVRSGSRDIGGVFAAISQYYRVSNPDATATSV